MVGLQWLTAHYWYIYGAGCGVMLLLMLIRVMQRRRAKGSTTHGSARWATPREIRRAGLFGAEGVMLGKYGTQYLRDRSEAHILLIAPTRGGKGVGPIICTLLTWPESVIV